MKADEAEEMYCLQVPESTGMPLGGPQGLWGQLNHLMEEGTMHWVGLGEENMVQGREWGTWVK